MRHLIWYLKSVFCNHEWLKEETTFTLYDKYIGDKILKQEPRVSLTCKKCGWHRTYKKY